MKSEEVFKRIIQNILGLDKLWQNSPLKNRSLMKKLKQQNSEKTQYSKYTFHYDPSEGITYTRNTYVVSVNTIDYKPLIRNNIMEILDSNREVQILGLTF